MSWVTVAWTAAIVACLTVALPNALVWSRDRTARAHLLLAVSAIATAALGVGELLTMRAATPETYGLILRWAHVPFVILIASLAWFVRLYLHAGRPWLAWTVVGTRAFASLVLNFLSPVSVNYKEIVRLQPVRLLGETVVVPVAIENPWVRVAELSSALFLVYLVDAAVTVWRRGDRRRALTVAGSMILFIVVVAIHLALLHAGISRWPYIVTFSFLVILLAMGYELSMDLVRGRELARQLLVSEAAVRESEQRLSLAAKAASIGMWTWDVHRDEFWPTPTERAIRGYADSERITSPRFISSIHPEDRENVRVSAELARKAGTDFEREYRVVRPDGEVRWITSRGAFELDASGAPVRVRGVSIDITPRKTAELELLQRRNELAHLSRVTMVSELSGSLAHELNQPLTAILSNAQAAQRLLAAGTPDLQEIREILDDIVSADKHASDVIQRIRVLLKKGEVNYHTLDVAEVVTEVLKIVRSDLVNQGVAVCTELARDLPEVSGDRVQLEQVVLNLVSNGCDAMAGVTPGERWLDVRTKRSESGGVHVSVEDRGTGIPDDVLSSVFEPFFTTKPHGTGLGLAVCRTIIDAHGGRIWASNDGGNPAGATFHFTLPAAGPQR